MVNFNISQNTKRNILYVIIVALIVSYIMNNQSLALVSLLFISVLAYMVTKNIIISLVLSIIITNLLLSMNYFVIEGYIGTPPTPTRETKQSTQPTQPTQPTQLKDLMQSTQPTQLKDLMQSMQAMQPMQTKEPMQTKKIKK
jgi:hypothetical protein